MSKSTINPSSEQVYELIITTLDALLKNNPNYGSMPSFTDNPTPICMAAVMEMLAHLYGIADSIESSATTDPQAIKVKNFIRSKFGETPPVVNQRNLKLN